MRYVVALFCLVFSCFLQSKESEVDLSALIANHDYLVVRFVKHGCPGCIHMNKVIDTAKKKFPLVAFEDIQYENNKSLASRYKIKAVPTIILFQKGIDLLHYKGTMTYEELKTLIKTTFIEVM